MKERTKVLFVCMGNICRSPSAEGIFRKLVKDASMADDFEIDSAGTSAYHIGEAPDMRSCEHALKRGYDLSSQRSRKVAFEDFYEFDHILAMDSSNYENLIEIAPSEHKHKVKLMLEYGTSNIKEVPDPYSGGAAGFENVLDLLEDACQGLLKDISEKSKH